MIGTVLAGVAGALFAVGVVFVLPSPTRGIAAALGREIRALTTTRGWRLRLAAALAGAFAGAVVFGLRAAVLCGAAGAWLVPRVVAARRRRYGRRLDEGAAGAARAIADSISAGASLRTSVAAAAGRAGGPIGEELGRTAWELEMGAATEAALERLRSRSASHGVGVIVAAMQVQRRSGGNLAQVLRGVATALEQDWQVIEEANAATAQARFTAMVVVALPLCGIVLGTLASPELPARMTGSAVGMGLLMTSLALQLSGGLLIRRLARSWR